MTHSQSSAIALMNQWGAAKIPFFFIVDFEMEAIQLYRLDTSLPQHIRYSFHEVPSAQVTLQNRRDLIFKKNPIPFDQYECAFKQLQKQICSGNSFLANLTFPTPIETNLSLLQIYELSHAPYKLLVDGQFVCFSPETFITIRNGIISTCPMKGTINAALPQAEQLILESPKETAEHHTVVDLLRNDLSKMAHDVRVKRFRYIERIVSNEGSLLQVSSEITGKLPADFHGHLGDILFSLLPAGSVTGAPKIMTTAIIREVECARRGYYTGVCGIFDGEQVDSAVMIRFIEICDGKMLFKSGGGITFMSQAREEYNELIDKVYVSIA